MSIDILKQDIKSNEFRSVYLFYGPEDYLKKYYLDSIENTLIKKDVMILNKIVLEGKVDMQKIIEACETMPIFSDKKIVLVKNSGFFKSKKKSENEVVSKPQNDALQTYIKNLPQSTCLIFCEAEVDKRMKIVDQIKKNGLIVEFAYQKPPELAKWAIKVFKSFGKEIDLMTSSQLVDSSEQGMNEILNEINKVVMYLGDRQKITIDDIEKICTKSIKSRIFDLTDAIAEKNGAKALKLLNEMIILKEPLPKILFMIAKQLRNILEMKLLCDNGMGLNEAASKMGITTYLAGKIKKQANCFSVEILKEIIEYCLELDLAIKTGKMNDRIATEMIITKLAK